MYTRSPLAQTCTRRFALGDNRTHKINSTILKYAIRTAFIIVFLKIVELVISIKRIEIILFLENLNSTIFMKMLQKLERKPTFLNRRVEKALRSLSNADRNVLGRPSGATQRSTAYVLLPA